MLAKFNSNWNKIDAHSWGNKAKNVKVQIVTEPALNILSLDFVAADMPLSGGCSRRRADVQIGESQRLHPLYLRVQA
jgi:hypothetical protein